MSLSLKAWPRWAEHTACHARQSESTPVKRFSPPLAALAALLLAALATPAAAQQPFATTAPILPNRQLTPGDTLDVTLADIQEHGYSARVRNVPIAVKRQVYASYGITHWVTGEYEVDHLIPLSWAAATRPRTCGRRAI